MHRVELKVDEFYIRCSISKVPNAPCGVESFEEELHEVPDQFVPNAPCGVES